MKENNNDKVKNIQFITPIENLLDNKGILLYYGFMAAVYLFGFLIYYIFTFPLLNPEGNDFYITTEMTAPAYRSEDCNFLSIKCAYFGQIVNEYGEYNFSYEKTHIGFNPKKITIGFKDEEPYTFRYIPLFNSKVGVISIAIFMPLIYIIIAIIVRRKFKHYLLEKYPKTNKVPNNNVGESNEKNI